MRVVYIADIGIEGGATKSLVELVVTMKYEHGIEPVVITSGNNRLNQLLDEQKIENYAVGHGAFLQGAPVALWKKTIKYIIYGAYYYIRKKSSLRKALDCVDWTKVDLIHTNVARDDIGMEISKITGVPNICHIREFAELDFNCWSYIPNYVGYLNKNTNGFIAISEAVKSYWVKKGLEYNRIKVIYNGVAGNKIIAADHSKWKYDKDIKIVIVGGVIPNKGQWQAIEAICLLPTHIRECIQLDIIGNVTDSYREKLLSPLRKKNLTCRVNFLGGCNDVYSRLKDYHIGLMCSKAEGFGRVTVEYMHAGIAVIASNTGANPEIIQDGNNGLLYEYGKVQMLADKIATLYLDRSMLIAIAIHGQEMAKEKYTKERNALEIMDIYLEYMRGV